MNKKSCPEATADGIVYDIEVASLSKETNAHIGNFSDYDVKICCSEFCEMYQRNDSCWEKPDKRCSWTFGRTKIYPTAGCCEGGPLYNGTWTASQKDCRYQSALGDMCPQFWAPENQIPEESVFPTNPNWTEYCAKMTEYPPGIRQEVTPY